MSGWVKIHRSIRDSDLWSERPFTRAQAWIDLILRANFKETTWHCGNETLTIPRGTFVISVKRLCLDWGWTRERVRRFLDTLVVRQKATIKTTNKYTSISLINYDSYQDLQPAEEPPKEPAKNQQATINRKHHKNDKEIKKERINTNKVEVVESVWMTIEEVKKLEDKFGIEDAKSKIEALSLWIIAKGKQNEVKSAYATILNWDRMRQERAKSGQSIPQGSPTQNRAATAILRSDGSVSGDIDFNRLPASAKVAIMNNNVAKHFEEKERLENLNKNKEIDYDNGKTDGKTIDRVLRAVPQLGLKIRDRG